MEENAKQQEVTLKLPKNVKQVGAIDKNSIIYVEDYVMTYLKQMIKKDGLQFGVAALYGRTVFQGKEKYVFVSGAVFAEDKPGEKKSSQDIVENGPTKYMLSQFEEKKETYFSELTPVGIAILHNENKTIPQAWLHKSKVLSLLGRGSVLISMDTREQEPEMGEYKEESIEDGKGYYVYYDKNEVMQGFLVEWHETQQTDCGEEAEDYAAGSCRMVLNERKESRTENKESSYVSAGSMFMLVAACIVGIVIVNYYNQNREGMRAETMPVSSEMTQQQEELILDLSAIDEPLATGDAVATDRGENNTQSASEHGENNNSGTLAEGETETGDNGSEEEETGDDHSDSADESAENSTDGSVSETAGYGDDNVASSETGNNSDEPSENEAEDEGDGLVSEDGGLGENDSVTSDASEDTAEETAATLGGVEYTIVPGDTLESISRRYYGDILHVDEICEINNIEDKNSILYGQSIILP